MGLFNTSKEMLDAIKSIVTDGRKQYTEEQQEMDKIVAEKILSPKQKKIAAVAGDKDKIDAADFAALRAGKKVAEAMGNPGPVRKPVPHSFKEKPSKEDMAAWQAKQKMTKEEVESVDEMSSKEKMKKGLYNKKVAEAQDLPSQRRASIDALSKGNPRTTGQKILSKVTGGRVDARTQTDPETGKKHHDITIVKNKKGSSDRPVGSMSAGKSTFNLRVKEAAERDTPGQHSCAVHVKHSTFGEGKALYSQHAEPDEAGLIEWYDIMFEHGIEKQVPTSDLEVLEAMSHGNHKGKK